jgi:hypothetical protein
VLYEPDRKFMPKGSPEAPASGVDTAAMQNAAHRAVSEGLKALFDDYTVSAEELGDFKGADVSGACSFLTSCFLIVDGFII